MSLEKAVRAGDMPAAIAALHAGSDCNMRGPEGLTPLMIASGLGDAQMTELLLTAGADGLAIEPRAGAAAIHKAALSGNPDVVDLLLRHGVFIDQQSPILGHTALMDAVVYKHENVVRTLLARGARTSIRNHWNETALDIARRDELDAIARLIGERNEADRAQIEANALASAVKRGDLAAVEDLIASGAAIDQRLPMVGTMDDDYTPLAMAARAGHAAIVRALLVAGADPRRAIGLYQGTALHEASYFGHVDVVKVMTSDAAMGGQARPDVDAQGVFNGMTPLHDAAWHGHMEASRALVDAGHPLNLRTHAGLTAREIAVLYGYDDLAAYLLGAETTQVATQNTTPLALT